MLQFSKSDINNTPEATALAADVTVQNADTLLLTGDVTAQNVVALRAKGEAMIQSLHSKSVINLSGLCSANTITLSLLLSWLRFAKRSNVSLTISQPPNTLFDMARVSGLELVLPFESVGR
ncbi:STAS domain-containing protein [Alkalimarinus sediminis]|uniref:STAS domain-containing protein n=1 Tax=Alkalimarinus sediminis TaxID=1632866 RepID=A0A9E8HFH3_9ALTE|nr:STAS domain-containing protein [Alkalimarinus sediminis]UZW73479.1 STAS domain-containing protein [Alkalimarinus sediminis]